MHMDTDKQKQPSIEGWAGRAQARIRERRSGGETFPGSRIDTQRVAESVSEVLSFPGNALLAVISSNQLSDGCGKEISGQDDRSPSLEENM